MQGGRTALMYASRYGHAFTARVLIEQGAAVNYVNKVRIVNRTL